MTVMKFRPCAALSILLSIAIVTVPSKAQVDVLTQHNDNARTGSNIAESVLTPANVNPQHFGMLAKHAVDDQVYSQPLVATGIKIAGGTHDVAYITTVNNSVYAFDANDATAAGPLWHVNFGMAANLYDADFGCLDMNGNFGIVGTPVINPEKTALYVVALTNTAGHFEQRLHALDLATGADLPNSPTTIEAAGFDPLMQNQRPALFIHHGNIYISYASHCDKGPYHGFLLAYSRATLKRSGVFNTSPGGLGASIWQSGQAPSIDADGNIYIVTGNGSWNGSTQWSESFLKLSPQLKLLDWFTPSNHFQLDKDDNDLNSSGATLIPGSHLAVGGGKLGVLYVLDTSHLGHLGDQRALQHVKVTSSHLHSLVYWNSAKNGQLLYIWGQRDRARVYRIDGGKVDKSPVMSRDEKNEGHPGAMLSLSADGKRDGILWASIHASGDSWHESRPGILHAYDADDIDRELWNSLENRDRDDCGEYSKMAPPTIANGRVYLASFGAKNRGTGQLCIYGILPGHGKPPEVPTDFRAIGGRTFLALTWSPVPGALTYTVQRTSAAGTQIIASGLTLPAYRDPASEPGDLKYSVIAVNANGASEPSPPTGVTLVKTPKHRDMPMH